jgi:hypothetical protein
LIGSKGKKNFCSCAKNELLLRSFDMEKPWFPHGFQLKLIKAWICLLCVEQETNEFIGCHNWLIPATT